MNLLPDRDVYNLICGKPGTVVIDIRSAEDYAQSHIVIAQNYSDSDYSGLEPKALLEKITTTNLKKFFGQNFNFFIFVSDENTSQYFPAILDAFRGSKFKNIFFMESPYGTFKNSYPWICSENWFLNHVSELPCEILPGLFLGPYPPNKSKELTERYFRALRITHVMNVTLESTYMVPKDIEKLQLRLNDERNENLPFDAIVKFLDTAFSASMAPPPSSSSSSDDEAPPPPSAGPTARILVHCKQGVSRSASCVCAFIIYKFRCTVRQALQLVRTERSVVQPIIDFIRQLYCFESQIGIFDAENKFGDVRLLQNAKPAVLNVKDFTRLPPATVNLLGVFHSGSVRVIKKF